MELNRESILGRRRGFSGFRYVWGYFAIYLQPAYIPDTQRHTQTYNVGNHWALAYLFGTINVKSRSARAKATGHHRQMCRFNITVTLVQEISPTALLRRWQKSLHTNDTFVGHGLRRKHRKECLVYDLGKLYKRICRGCFCHYHGAKRCTVNRLITQALCLNSSHLQVDRCM